ncbi:MAG: hypothetical protein JJ863_23700 [Deltaproteobacteria bacterium]|nr:hypothetical protein [Deltaproteobacteria bacterium]
MPLFSYHVIEAPAHRVALRLMAAGKLKRVPGLLHSERLLRMRMGAPVLAPTRYRFGSLIFIGLWESEAHLDEFLAAPPYPIFQRPSYHLRLRAYRRWGSYRGIDQAEVPTQAESTPSGQVVGLTLARLRLSQTLRFARWGRPVEAQVRDHPGMLHGAVSFRPFNTFSTFSVWENEEAMLGMVRGRAERDGSDHRKAMIERAKRPFHHEFITLRLEPLSEHGAWPDPRRLLPAP